MIHTLTDNDSDAIESVCAAVFCRYVAEDSGQGARVPVRPDGSLNLERVIGTRYSDSVRQSPLTPTDAVCVYSRDDDELSGDLVALHRVKRWWLLPSGHVARVHLSWDAPDIDSEVSDDEICLDLLALYPNAETAEAALQAHIHNEIAWFQSEIDCRQQNLKDAVRALGREA